MAIEDALRAILDDWAQVEPLLTVSELAELASVGWGTMRGAESASGPEPESNVFAIISAALPSAHPAWAALAALAARSGSAPDPRPTLELDLIDLASVALDDPRSAIDRSADELAEQSLVAMVGSGAISVEPGLEVPDGWLSVRVGGQLVVPSFQFASADTSRQYEAVAALAEQLCAREDPAGAVAWWLTPNPWLSARPADLLGTEREPELAYAADQLVNDSW